MADLVNFRGSASRRPHLNKNHRLFNGSEYKSMPLVNEPLVTEYLGALDRVMRKALDHSDRVFALRFDLHLPPDTDAYAEGFSNTVVPRFLESLKAKIRHQRRRGVPGEAMVRGREVRYFWVREVGDWGRVHYPCVLLNGCADNGLVHRVREAWASALGRDVENTRDLVHYPRNPENTVNRDDPASIARFFQRASSLCQARTKHYGHGHHGYGASRT